MKTPKIAIGERGWFGEPNAPAATIPGSLDRWIPAASAPPAGKAPQCVICMGGVGAGKTTLRHEHHPDHVAIDPGEVYNALTDGGQFVPTNIGELYETVGQRLAIEAIRRKRNIVVEVIGEEVDPLRELIDRMRAAGFEIRLVHVSCDPAEAYKRHLAAAANDPTYVSAYHGDLDTYRWVGAAARVAVEVPDIIPVEDIHVFAPLDADENSHLYRDALEEHIRRHR